MLVEDVMDSHPPLCFRGQDLVAAARTIHESGVAGAPVFDPELRLVGVLSLDDLVRWEAGRNDSRKWLRTIEEPPLVAHAMTHDVIGVSAHESISDAARVMRYASRRVLPVLDALGSFVGMISASDIAGAVARTDTSIRDEVSQLSVNGHAKAEPGTFDVHVDAGTVTLTGAVETRGHLMRLRQDIASITGVSYVDTENLATVRSLRSVT